MGKGLTGVPGIDGAITIFENEEELDAGRRSVWEQKNGRWGYRPSSIGGCIRGLVACKLGMNPMDPTEEDLIQMNEGHIHEPHVAGEWVKKHKGIWERHRRIQLTTDDGDIMGTVDGVWWPSPASGKYWHPDGVANEQGVDPRFFYLGEIKAMGESAHNDTKMGGAMDGPGLKYDWQKDAYYYGLWEQFGVAPLGIIWNFKNRNNGIIESYEYPGAKVPKSDFEVKVTLIDALSSLGIAGFEEVDCDQFDVFCDWWHLHKYDKRGLAWDERLLPIAERLYEILQQEKKLEAERKELKRALERAMLGKQNVRCGELLAYEGNTGERFDKGRWAQENPEEAQVIEEKLDTAKKFYRAPGTRWVSVKMAPQDKKAQARMDKVKKEEAKDKNRKSTQAQMELLGLNHDDEETEGEG